jgi:hypothetical protein
VIERLAPRVLVRIVGPVFPVRADPVVGPGHREEPADLLQLVGRQVPGRRLPLEVVLERLVVVRPLDARSGVLDLEAGALVGSPGHAAHALPLDPDFREREELHRRADEVRERLGPVDLQLERHLAGHGRLVTPLAGVLELDGAFLRQQ